MSATRVFDAGLQPERTQLSWRRTALSVVIGSVVSLRVLPVILDDPGWYAPGIVGVAFAAWMWITGNARYREFNAQLRSEREPIARGAAALAVLAAFTVGVGLLALVAVLALGVRVGWG